MNIKDLPPPHIKPTKSPSIMKDTDKEARFAAGQSLGTSLDSHNPNAQPNKGGIIQNVSKFLEQQNQNIGASDSTAFKLPKKKKGNPGIGVAIIIIWILFAIIGSVTEETFDEFDTFDTSPSSSLSDPQSSDTAGQIGTVSYETSCLRITIPETSIFGNAGLNDCEVSFDEGYSFSRTAFVSFDGSFFYESAEDYVARRGLEIDAEINVNGQPVYIINDGVAASSTSEYLFWIRDLGITNAEGELIESVTFYVFDSAGNNQELAEIILSVDFFSTQ